MDSFQDGFQVSEQVVRDAGFSSTGIELRLVSLAILMCCFWPIPNYCCRLPSAKSGLPLAEEDILIEINALVQIAV